MKTTRQGKSFGRYQIIEEIGRGGMGVVYLAYDPEVKRQLAIKAILGKYGKQQMQRFIREARAMGRLNHPNIVSIYEMAFADGVPYIAMDYIAGRSLDLFVSEEKPSVQQLAEVIATVAEALHCAHKQGIIHRDIKPGNILIDAAGAPHVMDFGLALSTQVADKTITKTGEVLGTPHYMSPEQARGEFRKLDRRSDVYSLGVLLYELLTGESAVKGNNILNVLVQVMRETPPRVRDLVPHISLMLDEICHTALQKDCGKRYQSALDMARDLRAYLKGRAAPVVKKKNEWKTKFTLCGLAIALFSVCLFLWLQDSPETIEDPIISGNFENSTFRPEEAYVGKAGLDVARARDMEEKGQHWQSIEYYTQAIAACREALRIDPSYRRAFLQLLDALRRRALAFLQQGAAAKIKKQYDEAMVYFANAERDARESWAQHKDSETRNILRDICFTRASMYHYHEGSEKEQYEKALAYYEETLALDPQFTQAHCQIATLLAIPLFGREPTEKILARFERILPHFTEAYQHRALVYHYLMGIEKSMQYYEKALEDYNRAIQFSDKDHLAGHYLQRGILHRDRARWDPQPMLACQLALKDFTKVISLDPNHVEVYIERATTYVSLAVEDRKARKKWLGKAIADYTVMISRSPLDSRGYKERSHAFNMLDQYQSAIADLTKAIALAPEDEGLYIRRGDMYEKRSFQKADDESMELAYQEYSKAISIAKQKKPEQLVTAYMWRGNLQVKRNMYEKAIEDFQKALAYRAVLQHQVAAEIYYRRGTVYLYKEALEKASADFSEAIALLRDKQNITDKLLLGKCYRQRALCRFLLGDSNHRTDLAQAKALGDKWAAVVDPNRMTPSQLRKLLELILRQSHQ